MKKTSRSDFVLLLLTIWVNKLTRVESVCVKLTGDGFQPGNGKFYAELFHFEKIKGTAPTAGEQEARGMITQLGSRRRFGSKKARGRFGSRGTVLLLPK
jgi:hypothetical protein